MSGSSNCLTNQRPLIIIASLLILSITPLLSLSENSLDIKFALTQDSPTRDYWPTDGWRYSTPEEQGMSNDTLNQMMEVIEDEEYPIYSVLVIKNGYAIYERYPHEYISENHLQLLHSVTKSFTSTLIGIAIHQGLIDGVNESVLNFFPEYTITNPDPRKDSITIQDLLTMTPGFDWDEWSTPYEYGSGNNLMEMMSSSDAVQYVLDRPMSHTPGEHWVYNGGASVLLGAIVQQVSNQSTLSFAQDYLFDPLGFGPSFWYTTSGGWINAHGGLGLTTRDLAKLGFLYLNNGFWNGTEMLSADFVSSTTTPISLANPLGSNFGYGWHWWMRSDLGIYFAYGRHGQKIMVAPEHDMVVVFTANIPDDGYDPEFELFRDYILQAIIDNSTDSTLFLLGILSVSGIGIIVIVIIYVHKRKRMH